MTSGNPREFSLRVVQRPGLGFLASPTLVSWSERYIELVKGSPSDRVSYPNVHSLDGFLIGFCV